MSSSDRQFPLGILFLTIFGLIGLILLSIGGFLWYRQTQFLERARETEGLVVDLVPNDNMYAPVVRFFLPNGDEVVFRSSISSNPSRYAVEDQVTVFYDPERPSDARIGNWFDLWFASLLLSIMGGIFSVVGIIIFVAVRRSERL
ncbi:MAG: DUF3592 domain-containing protein [Chloroflexota bacterium]